MPDTDITPIRKQYLEIKRQYPDAILFFRLGDFYETFDHDAEITSRELDIVLTSRNVAKGVRIPMAGIPHHAAENYLSRLIQNGYHVAICEQVGDQPVKGLFPRMVTRVVTPGTVVEPGLLPGDANNYLACVMFDENISGDNDSDAAGRAGIAYVDITTGEYAASEISGIDIRAAVRAELARLHPAEILYPDTQKLPDGIPAHSSPWPRWRFETGRCQEKLRQHFEVGSLDGFGLRGLNLATCAAGAVLQYISDTQPAALKLLVSLSTYSLSDFMILDAATRRNLELIETLRANTTKGSLLGIIDHTVTPMGKRLILQWVNKPLLDVERIRVRQEGVTHFYNDGLLRSEARAALKTMGDLERLINRVISFTAQPRDLVYLQATMSRLPGLHGLFREGA